MRKECRISLYLALVAYFVDVVHISLSWPILPYLVKKWHADAFWNGVPPAGYALAQVLSNIMFSRLADWKGTRLALLVAFVGTAIGNVACGLSWNMPTMTAARAFTGLFAGVPPVVLGYIAKVSSKEENPKYMGWAGALFAAGYLTGPALSGALGSLDLLAPYWFATGLAALTFFALLLFFRDFGHNVCDDGSGAASGVAGVIADAHEKDMECGNCVREEEEEEEEEEEDCGLEWDCVVPPRQSVTVHPVTFGPRADSAVSCPTKATSQTARHSASAPPFASEVHSSSDTQKGAVGKETTLEKQPQSPRAIEKPRWAYILLIAFAMFFHGGSLASPSVITGPHLQDAFGITVLQLGIINAGLALGGIIVQFVVFRPLQGRIGLDVTGLLGETFGVFCLLLVLAWKKSLVAFIIFRVGYTLGNSVVIPTVPATLALFKTKEKTTLIVGLGQSAQAAARVIFPLAFGFLYDVDNMIPWWFGGLLGGLGSVVWVVLVGLGEVRRRQRSKDSASEACLRRTDSSPPSKELHSDESGGEDGEAGNVHRREVGSLSVSAVAASEGRSVSASEVRDVELGVRRVDPHHESSECPGAEGDCSMEDQVRASDSAEECRQAEAEGPVSVNGPNASSLSRGACLRRQTDPLLSTRGAKWSPPGGSGFVEGSQCFARYDDPSQCVGASVSFGGDKQSGPGNAEQDCRMAL